MASPILITVAQAVLESLAVVVAAVAVRRQSVATVVLVGLAAAVVAAVAEPLLRVVELAV